MSDPLFASEGQLQPHWNTLSDDVLNLLALKPKVKIQANPAANSLIAAFYGETETTGRLKGGRMTIVPLCLLSKNWEAWIGFREVWQSTPTIKNTFVFDSCDLTIFMTEKDSKVFRQLLRAEWSGLSENGENNWMFRPSDAGHPHWQVDVAEMLSRDADVSSALELLKDTAPKQFGAQPTVSSNLMPFLKVGAMHLASSMRPWTDSEIAHGPKELVQIRQWATGTIQLLVCELDRL
jgi:hypothetical protein